MYWNQPTYILRKRQQKRLLREANKMDNTYLVVNGVKVPLTEEQKKEPGVDF